MITDNGKKNIWKDVFSTSNYITLALGYYDASQADPFTELSKTSIEQNLGNGQTTPSTAPTNRNYERLRVQYVDSGDVNSSTSTNAVYLTFKTEDDEIDYSTVINAKSFVFNEIDDGSPDNINNKDAVTTDYGGWGTITGIALFTGTSNSNALTSSTMIYAAPLTNPITTSHAMQLRFPAEQLSFTLTFVDE